MLRVRHVEELSPADQIALRMAPLSGNTIIITQSRPGEMNEPRHFLRRALYLFRRQARKNDRQKIALKAIGLIGGAAMAAQQLGSWSTGNTYDPLPDFRALEQQASNRLGRGTSPDEPVAQLMKLLAEIIGAFEGTTSEQRIGLV